LRWISNKKNNKCLYLKKKAEIVKKRTNNVPQLLGKSIYSVRLFPGLLGLANSAEQDNMKIHFLNGVKLPGVVAHAYISSYSGCRN
jgi:hypothetical protein